MDLTTELLHTMGRHGRCGKGHWRSGGAGGCGVSRSAGERMYAGRSSIARHRANLRGGTSEVQRQQEVHRQQSPSVQSPLTHPARAGFLQKAREFPPRGLGGAPRTKSSKTAKKRPPSLPKRPPSLPPPGPRRPTPRLHRQPPVRTRTHTHPGRGSRSPGQEPDFPAWRAATRSGPRCAIQRKVPLIRQGKGRITIADKQADKARS
jgi:hypothetical protein